MRNGILIQDHKLNFKLTNSYDDTCRRIRSVFGPSKSSFPSSSIFYYGNSIKNYCAIEKSVTRDTIQIRDDNATVGIYSRDDFYEPIMLKQASKNYDPTIRPWFKAGLSKTYPDYMWSPVFFNAFIGATSLGASTTLDFINTQDYVYPNGTVETRNVTQIVGAHFDLYNIDSSLVNVIEANKDMQTISIKVLIVERHGLIISSSFNAQTKDPSNVRNHISNTTEVFSEVCTVLEDRKILYHLPKSMWGTATTIPTSTIKESLDPNADFSMFMVGNSKITIHQITDNGLDWIVVIVTEDYGFVKTIFTSSPALLSVSIILIILGTLLMIVVTQFITRSIWKVSRDMYKISKLEVDTVKPSKVLKTMYELDLLQTSIKTVKNGLHSFMKYIPKDIVRDIVRTGNASKLGMANANSTVMFTDIADFTSFSESSSLSVLLKILTEYFNIITETVEAHDGIIDKFIGDGTMSLFSNPLRVVQDHAYKGTRAAVLCLYKIDQLKSKCIKENLPIVKIRVGVNTGNCMMGNIGSKDRFSFTAIGDTVNTAGRLEMLNKRYDTPILIGNNTYEIVKNKFICMYVDSVRLKGKSKPTEVYTVDGEIEDITSSQKVVSDRLLRIRDALFDKKYDTAVEEIEEIYRLNAQWKETYKPEELAIDYSSIKYIAELKRRAQYLKSMAEKNCSEDYALALTEK
ncbi:predicted protein [Naegleria gruberi]|uniref:Predicted protein n=1 Tax=Naegleria gruberi TaxID=5762 RepID=D2VKE8_NAEGR|nr:uncharacterized protein NAEGRDRAFT_50277 [Naegleria gruberi]EFC42674.1 predicted protein [Naegleria gruberi]|eukprot:XP_002675418.1 predicted protein [Naegleria gruberi strain NEG-M]